MVSPLMNTDRGSQSLLLDGKRLSPQDLTRMLEAGEAAHTCEMWDLLQFLARWFDPSPTLTVHTSGSTGTPKAIVVNKAQMIQSARLTCEFLKLQPGDSALLCMNLRYIGAMMMVVRSLVAGLNLSVRPASGHPLAEVTRPPRFAAMVPLQVYNTLHTPEERTRLAQTGILIIGGGAIDATLERELQSLPGEIYSTYGMTETLSHIALRRLNGPAISDHYQPFDTVALSLSAEGTLVINAPRVCDQVLHTNDMARLYPDGSFTILGRKDNVINSGGIKIQAEEVEKALYPLIPVPFAITSVDDARLGQAVTLLVQQDSSQKGELQEVETLKQLIRRHLPPYHCPRHILFVPQLPMTGNGKIDRNACRSLALLK